MGNRGKLGGSSVGRGRDGSVDMVDRWETVRNSLGRASLARVFRTNSLNAIVPKNCAPKTFQVVCKRWAMGHA